MPKQPPRSHFSPIFANKHWANSDKLFTCYLRDEYQGEIAKKPKGLKPWARQRGLYSWAVENALDQTLETYAAPIYEKLVLIQNPTAEERLVWAQFILSQLVRTPSFMAYEGCARRLHKLTETPVHDRVGCVDCLDLAYITSRDWCLLLAHEDDHFVRSDNPVLISGFIERPETCLYYPLTPRICFVACSMQEPWIPTHPSNSELTSIFGRELEKGDAWMFNFHLARSANESLVLHPGCEGHLAESMFSEVLGVYPQPPFPLHSLVNENVDDAFESIRLLMNLFDGVNYPAWRPHELEPFYR
jgi:hypothetical protein